MRADLAATAATSARCTRKASRTPTTRHCCSTATQRCARQRLFSKVERAKWERVEPERAKWERVEPSVGPCQVRDVEKLDQFIKGSNVSFDVETAIKVRHLSSPRTRTVLYGGQTL